MKRLGIGIAAFCALTTVAGYFAAKRNTGIDDREVRAAATVAATPTGTQEILMIDVRGRPAPVAAKLAREFLPVSDTTGLLQESLTIGELLDEIEADSGHEFMPVDRERLAAQLKSDPELRRVLSD